MTGPPTNNPRYRTDAECRREEAFNSAAAYLHALDKAVERMGLDGDDWEKVTDAIGDVRRVLEEVE